MAEFDQSKYINNFIKETYDTIKVQVQKGQKEIIKNRAKEKGYKSLNAYINDLIKKDLNETAGEQKKTINIGRDNIGNINM